MATLAACGVGNAPAAPTSASTPVSSTAVSSTAAPKTGGTLRVARSADVLTLDPHNYQAVSDLMVTDLVFDTLVAMDRQLNVVPRLAESWQQVDPNTLRVNLRDGARFTDGNPINADAVKASFTRAKTIPHAQVLYGPIDTIDTPDARTVVFKTKQPFGPLLRHLANPIGGIMSADAIAKWGDDIVKHPVGSGPWKLDEFVAKEQVTLSRNDDYWGAKTRPDKLIFRYIPEEGTRYNALLAGEVEVVGDPPPSKIAEIKSNNSMRLVQGPATRVFHIGFNMTDASIPLELRQAIGYAINRQDIIDSLLEGLGEPVTTFISPMISKVTPTGKWPEYNLDQAKKLIAAVNKPAKLTISAPQGAYLKDKETAEVVQQQLQSAGLNVDVQTYDSGTFFNLLPKHQYQLYYSGWGFITGDPDQGLRGLLASSSPINYPGYNNPKFDQLLDQASAATDQSERDKLYSQAEDMLIADQVMAPIYVKVNAFAVSNKISDFYTHPLEILEISQVSTA